jgi:BTB/POZ domain
MFTSELSENKNNKTKIADTSKEVFEEFLRFIYTGEVKDIVTHVVDLLALSHKYEVVDLTEKCEAQLLKGLDESNAHDIFQYAHLFNCSQHLKATAFGQIKK